MHRATSDIPPLPRAKTVRDLFRERRLRHTRQRDLVYSTLISLRTHPTAEELHAHVNLRDRGVSLATVYNTLDALARCGLLRKIPSLLGGGACRFDADLSGHVHVVHPEGSVHDVPDDLGEPLLAGIGKDAINAIERRLGLKVVGVTVQLVTARAD
ncbi:MAG: transcriptional repressor [Phycisphaerae bacterium]|jgi:Fe2+ or Zn2+ uptake regulation protein